MRRTVCREEALGLTSCGGRSFHWGTRTYVMGIVNVSPDSFGGDGLADAAEAGRRARQLADEGADIIDLGGESTRPGSTPIDATGELQRLAPALDTIRTEVTLPVSIDSYKFEVVSYALRSGANMINDVWGLKQDPRLAQLAVEHDVPIILVSNQRDIAPHHDVHFSDIVATVAADLRRAIDVALQAGVPWQHIIIDPGIGFGKTQAQNMELLRRLHELKPIGRPVLLATSRKSVIGRQLGLPPEQRGFGTAATLAIGIDKGADMVRVHDVRLMLPAVKMADAIVRGTH